MLLNVLNVHIATK